MERAFLLDVPNHWNRYNETISSNQFSRTDVLLYLDVIMFTSVIMYKRHVYLFLFC